jgi:hypothetical protein
VQAKGGFIWFTFEFNELYVKQLRLSVQKCKTKAKVRGPNFVFRSVVIDDLSSLTLSPSFVMLNPAVVTLNPSAVMLNEVKHLRVNSVKSLMANSVKHLARRSEESLWQV